MVQKLTFVLQVFGYLSSLPKNEHCAFYNTTRAYMILPTQSMLFVPMDTPLHKNSYARNM